MDDNYAVAVVMVVIVLSGPALVAYTFRGRQRLRELAMRERIALIEKGIVPPPEVDPARFEAHVLLRHPVGAKAAQYRSAGVIIMGLGCALLMLLTFAAGVPSVALGIGGGFAILGLAIFVNGTLLSHDQPSHSALSSTREPTAPEPPTNIAP